MDGSTLSKDDPSSASRPVDQWLLCAREGSRSALGLALEAGRKYLLLLANRTLDDKLQAKVGASDLVQDTYFAAQRDFGQFRGTTEAEFYCWLSSILAHRLANTVRRYRSTRGRDIDRELAVSVEEALSRIEDESATPFAALLVQDERQQVRIALERMEESMRSILIERIWRGDSFTQIAARRGCTADAVRKQWIRAVRKMRTLLEHGAGRRHESGAGPL